ncbi:hypothetical protein HCT14_00305 [Spirochaetales bacterium BR193]|uniref:Uncharacterized protein n=2 Tax=Entomospira entomophila TaxID=2719988 RepID=A0A968KS45_9SPIO|nr:hypothetical protein [Entomospira entomophilus]
MLVYLITKYVYLEPLKQILRERYDIYFPQGFFNRQDLSLFASLHPEVISHIESIFEEDAELQKLYVKFQNWRILTYTLGVPFLLVIFPFKL